MDILDASKESFDLIGSQREHGARMSIGSMAFGNVVAMECFLGADNVFCEFYENNDSVIISRKVQ